MMRASLSGQARPVAMAVVTTVLIAGPAFLDGAGLRLAMEMFAFLALASMWNLLAGYTGLISVGQQAFVGLGGYIFFALVMLAGIHPIPAMFVSMLASALIALPTGWIAFRLKGAYFAIGTWVIAEVFRLAAAQISTLGGGSGISLPLSVMKSLAASRDGREFLLYWVALAVALVSVVGVWLVLRSRWGLALASIRDSEVAAESVGVPAFRAKFLVYLITAGFTGLIGSFTFLIKLRISPEAAFSLNDWTAFVIFIVVIGGLGTIEGPIVGVIIFFLLREFTSDWGSWYLIMMGAIAIAVMLIDKRGVWGILRARGVPALFPTQQLAGSAAEEQPDQELAGMTAPRAEDPVDGLRSAPI